MTYSAEVLADTPVHFYRFNETSGTATDSGSAAMAGTLAGSITRGEAPAGTIDGTSMLFDGSLASNVTTGTSATTFTNNTIELWYKANTGYVFDKLRAIARMGTGTTYLKLWLNLNGGLLRVEDSTNGFTTGLAVAALADGNWHHIAVAKSGSTITYYVDGTSRGTETLTTGSKTIQVQLGNTGGGGDGPGGWIDEFAFYSTALSSTRVGVHYTAGNAAASTNKTVTAPAATMSLSAPAPVIRAGTGKTISAPAATLNLTAPVPQASGRNVAIEDRIDATNSRDNSTTIFVISTDGSKSLVKFNLPVVPAGMQVDSAVLHYNAAHNSGTSGTSTWNLRLGRITQAWAEGPATQFVTVGTTVDTSAALQQTPTFNWYTADITTIAQEWANGAANYGIRFAYVSQTGLTAETMFLSSSESASPAYISYTFAELPAVDINVTAPAATASITAPAPVVRAVKNVTVSAPADTLSLSAIAPTVSAATGISVHAPAATLSLTAPGGVAKNPDYRAFAPAIESWLTVPNANVEIQVPVTNTVSGAAQITLDAPDSVSVNLTTNVLRRVPAATMSLRGVGIFQKEEDRYFKILPTTMNSDDVWYQMEETSGTTMVDSMFSTSSTGQITKQQNGTYVGGPTFKVEGPQLRKAVAFDGVNDYLRMTNTVPGVSGYGNQSGNPTELFPGMAVTIEFSIKTTQRDGTLWIGGGYNNYNNVALKQHNGQPVQVRLEDGKIVAYSRGEYQFTVRKDIADGEWHHIVMSKPIASSELFVDRVDSGAHPKLGQPFFVNIDGKSEYTSYGFDGANVQGAELLPYTFMAKATLPVFTPPLTEPQNPTDFLAGSLRDVVVRLHYAVGQGTAQKLYYEWSNAYIAQPTPAIINLAAQAPHRAKGNVKRMLAVYGLPWGFTYDGNDRTPERPAYTYWSNLAGFIIDNYGDISNGSSGTGGVDHPATSVGTTLFGGSIYYEPKTFMLEDYLVYPVSITGDEAHPRTTPGTRSNNTGLVSAAGMITDDPRSPSYGRLVDEKTGLPRLINLQTDLIEPVEDFDVLTVVNYPWERADQTYEEVRENAQRTIVGNGPGTGSFQGARPVNYTSNLTADEWTQMRDKFRDSILEAAYSGVNLWIPEYHMAHHLGFIQGYDIHLQGLFANPTRAGDPHAKFTGFNKEAERLDNLHTHDSQHNWCGSRGDFFAWPQVNTYRRVVALEPGLTDIPTNDYKDVIERFPYDEYLPSGYANMWDILRRPNGLQIGDKIKTSIYEWYPGKPAGFGNQYKRTEVISAKPEGIVGKVITREMEFYYGPDELIVQNPYKDNAITIAAERGSIVRGRPIAGRAFMEFMDTDTLTTHIIENVNKMAWQGSQTGPNGIQMSTWDYDTRRDKEVKIEIVEYKMRFDNDLGQFESHPVTTRYFEYESADLKYNTYHSMNIRGLNWLGEADSGLPAGAVKVFASPVQITLSNPAPAFSRTRNVVSQATAAKLVIEVMQPRNYRPADFTGKVIFPANLTLEMRGLGKHIKVDGAATLDLSAPNATVIGDGERITVYLDGDRNITLFLKEDN
jgi:hypothetical protein